LASEPLTVPSCAHLLTSISPCYHWTTISKDFKFLHHELAFYHTIILGCWFWGNYIHPGKMRWGPNPVSYTLSTRTAIKLAHCPYVLSPNTTELTSRLIFLMNANESGELESRISGHKNRKMAYNQELPPTRGNASRQGVLSYLHALFLTFHSTETWFKSGIIWGQIDARYGTGEQLRFRKRQTGQLSYIWL